MALVQAGTAKPYGVTNPTGALTLTPSPLKSTATAPKALTVWSGGASVGILKPVVGASATLAPAVAVTGLYKGTPLPLAPKITPSKLPGALGVTGWEQRTPPAPEGAELRALPRPDSVPSLSWKTVGLFAAAGLAAYLIFHG